MSSITEKLGQLQSRQNASVMTAISCVGCIIVLGIAYALTLPVISLVFSIIYQDEPCMKVDIIGLDIAEWLFIIGIMGIVITCIFIAIRILSGCCADLAPLINVILNIISFIYIVIISSITAAIFFRSSLECLHQGTAIGIFTLIYLIIMWLSLLCTFCNNKKSDDED